MTKMLFTMLCTLGLTFGFATVTSASSRVSPSRNDDFTCRDLEVQLEVAQERADYAKNAWLNRESLCETDLNRPNCYDYFKRDLAAAKTELQYALDVYQDSGCPRN